MKKIIGILVIIFVVWFALHIEIGQEPAEIKNTEMVGTQTNEQKTQEVQETKPREKVSLEGKTIGLFGDSLIKGYGNEKGGFANYLKQELPNTNFVDYSKSGSTISSNTGTDDIIMLQQMQNLIGSAKPEIVIFDGGANDIMGYSLGFLNRDLQKEIGTVDMNQIGATQGESVIADFEAVVQQLRSALPETKLCYVQPFLLDDETISHLTQDENAKKEILNRTSAFFAQVQNACQKWDVEYLDLAQNFAGKASLYKQEDWIHINDAGYSLMMPILVQKLKDMMPYQKEENSYDCLVIGNSITLEKGGIGMAATDKEHDYYYLLEQKLKQKHEKVNMNRVSAIHWEENRIITSRTDWLKENLTEEVISNQDLVIFQLGDNCVPTESFEQSAIEMIEHVKQYSPNAKMIWVAMWFINEERLAMLPGICEKYGIDFVNITDLVTEEYQSYIGEKRTGVNGEDVTSSTREEAFHPNNKGMEMIAERIYEKLKQ